MTTETQKNARLVPHNIPFLTRIAKLLAAGTKVDRKEELLAHQREIIQSLQAELEKERLNHAVMYQEVRKAHKGISRRNAKIATLKAGHRKLAEVKQVLIGEKILVQEKSGEGPFYLPSYSTIPSTLSRAELEIAKILA